MAPLRKILRPVLDNALVSVLNRYGGIDVSAPVLTLAEVGNVADDTVTLRYNETLDSGSVPAAGDYSISGTTETITAVAITSNTVTLTISGDILNTETILIDYTAGTNPIRDVAINNAVNLTNQAVTNNIGTYLKDHNGDYILDHNGNKIPIT